MPLQINNDIEPPFPNRPQEGPNPAPPMSPIENNDFIDRWIVLHQGEKMELPQPMTVSHREILFE
jgi:hypothetical protein